MADTASAGSIERPSDYLRTQDADAALSRFWLDAIALATEDEKDWRTEAEKVVARYRGEREHKHDRFRILFSNVQTMAPALFNSQPIPDIRRRFDDRDEDARAVAQALERVVSCNAEKSDFEAVLDEAILHRLLPGRAVVRVRYEPQFAEDGTVAYEGVRFEPVPWSDFCHGPGKRWEDVQWVAFRIFPTREELEKLNPETAPHVPLVAKQGDSQLKADETRNPPTLYKRAEVWQVWHKESRTIIYVSPDYKDAPVAVVPDELKLEGFYPTPCPLLAIRSPDDLRPVTEWAQYASLADELEEITRRLKSLVRAARYRGVTAKELGAAFQAIKTLADGEFAQADDAITFSQEGGIDKGIWVMPLGELMAAIKQLYEAREQTKQAIYEVTGLSDILRGATEPDETATAQGIKAQWGSLRLQKAQGQVQRYCRDLYRLAVEIVATRFDPRSVMLAAGVELTPQQVELMRRDVMREYRIEVETDSTIRADLSRQQENIGQFVQGFGALMTGLGPAVESGYMQADEAADLLTGFARSFKLGRQAEEALERMGDRLREMAKKPQQAKPDPEVVKAQAQMQMAQQKHQLDMEAKQADLAMEQQRMAMEMQREQAKLQLEREKLELQREKMALDAEAARAQHQFDLQAQAEKAQFDRQQMAANAEHEDERRASELTFMRQRAAAKGNGEARA